MASQQKVARSVESTQLPALNVTDTSDVESESKSDGASDVSKDPNHPHNLPQAHKWTIVVLLSIMGLITNMAIISIGPATPSLLAELRPGPTSSFEQTFILTVWGLGQMSGPLLLCPLSEMYGRTPVYHVASMLFIIFSVAGALGTSVSMIIGFRFLMGFVAVAFALNPPIIGDLFAKEERGRAMSLTFIAPLFGAVIGPIVGGYISQSLGWRWVFWIMAIATAAFELGLVTVYRETYYPRILYRRAKKEDLEQKDTLAKTPTEKAKVILTSMFRPAKMLVTSPVIFLISIYAALINAYIYLLMGTMTSVFRSVYGLTEKSVGYTYLGIGIGMLIGVVFCGVVMDRYYRTRASTHEDQPKPEPEARLMPMIVGGIVIPIGLFMYGWSAAKAAPIPVPVVGTGIFAVGVAVNQVVSSSYLVDAFGVHAASAVAGSMTLRLLASAFLPLAAEPMYAKLGLGWGNSILGFLALALIPAPALLIRYGKSLRERSRYHVLL